MTINSVASSNEKTFFGVADSPEQTINQLNYSSAINYYQPGNTNLSIFDGSNSAEMSRELGSLAFNSVEENSGNVTESINNDTETSDNNVCNGANMPKKDKIY